MAVSGGTTRGPTAASRRLRSGALSLVTLLAAAGTVVVLNMLAARYDVRWDVTATRDQGLAERTLRVLNRLEGGYRIVIAVDLKHVDLRAKERVADVITEMRRNNRDLRSMIIDAGSIRGGEQYKELIAGLVAEEEPLIRAQVDIVEQAGAMGTAHAAYLLEGASPALLAIGEAITGGTPEGQAARAAFEQSAARCRLAARDLTQAVAGANDLLKSRLGDTALPATDRAAAVLATSLGAGVDHADGLLRDLQAFVESPVSAGPARDRAGGLAKTLRERRDRLAVQYDVVRRQDRPDVLRLADVFKSGSAALVIGPGGRGIAAIDPEALFPSAEYQDAAGAVRADLSRRAEELFTTALASLIEPRKPIVVLVHGERKGLLAATRKLDALKRRLSLRGIDLVEWAAAYDPEHPALAPLDPSNSRPVVYVGLSPDAAAAPPVRGDMNGAQRVQRFAACVDGLLGQGKHVMVNLRPSVLPTYGDTDPVSGLLGRFGLGAETGRPVLSEVVSGRGRMIEVSRSLFADESAHPIAGAVRGLPTRLNWPIAIVERPMGERARAACAWLFSVPADERTWQETQWLRLRQSTADQQLMAQDLPVFDPAQDVRWPEGKPTDKAQQWHVAAAVERYTVGSKPQRMVVIGSDDWFSDDVTRLGVDADGRVVPANPGNLELFEACVYWLSGQDDLIAQSPSARAVSMVMPIPRERLLRLHLIMIVGLPLGVLALGGTYLLWRR